MKADALRALQAPFKSRYKENPASALIALKAEGKLEGDPLLCKVKTHIGVVPAGLHPAAGGDGAAACAGDMLLEALVACTGVTLRAVATAMNIPVHGGAITAEGEMDFRGTLGVAKDIPVGFQNIRMTFHLDTDATPEQIDNLLKLTKRYCVVFQTLQQPPTVSIEYRRSNSSNDKVTR
jgi:uncharacterized OsmC-like protein